MSRSEKQGRRIFGTKSHRLRGFAMTRTIGSSAVSRRGFLALGASAAIGATTLAGCAIKQPTASGGGTEGTVRFAWWGNDARQKTIAAFANKFPTKVSGVKLQLEPSEYSGYSDKLSVQIAGQQLPDTFWVPANLAGTFGAKKVLLDFDTLPEGTVDFSQYAEGQVDSWKITDGKQLAPVYSQYSPAMQIDVTALNAVGIKDLPDEETWSWDDLSKLAVDYTKAKGEGNWGISNMSGFYQHAHMWIRQHGAEAFTADGKIGFDAAVVGDWFAWWQKATEAGGVMPSKISAGKTQWTQTAGKTALYLVQLNQFADDQAFSKDHDLQLIKSPQIAGASKDWQFRYYTRFCIAANTKNAELAGKFVNYMLNDPGNAADVGLASGIPSNPELVKAIGALGDPTAKKILDMTARIDKQPMRPRPEPPVGASGWQSLIEKASDDIFNGGVAIDKAVKDGIATLQATLDKG